MKGEARPLLQFLDGSDKRFIIPVYQRNYNWEERHCKQLFDDLVRLMNSQRKSHFFGSIVSAALMDGNSSDLLIIDGQQRITTISLLFLAMVNSMKKGFTTSNDPLLCRKIENKFLVDEYQTAERKVRLKPIKDDCFAFDKLLFSDEDDYIKSSNVTRNYNYFYERIQKTELSIDELYESIRRLVIIDIFLHQDDDPQLIFESLNSTGLGLEEGDKIRNYILMGVEVLLQDKYYNQYWNKIEKNTDFEVSSFVRDYLTLKQGRIPSFKTIYFSFKEYVENKEIDRETILIDLLKHSKTYRDIRHASTENEQLNVILSRLNQLEMSVTYPFLLALLEYSSDVNLAIEQIKEVLLCVEIYIFRRLIYGLPTNALNKIFCTLHKDVLRLKKEDDSYAEVVKYVLISKAASGAFPTDNEFLTALSVKNIYTMTSKNKEYLFERLENEDNVERVCVIKYMQNGTFSIEHIMPQTLTNQWKESLGEEYERIHHERLNTLANLTLTGYNSKYSNRNFVDKRDIQYGFRDSGLRINKYIAECEKWTEQELIERNNRLMAQALKLWKYPSTTFVSPVKVREEYCLADDYCFTGKTIASFNFKGTNYQVDSWKEMFVDVVKMIYEMNSSVIYRLADDSNFVDLSHNSNEHTHKIAENIYLYASTSTRSKIRVLNRIFEECDMDKELLSFEIIPTINED